MRFLTIICFLLAYVIQADTLNYTFTLPPFTLEKVLFHNEAYTKIITNESLYIIDDSVPEIPKYTKSILLDNNSSLKYNVYTADCTDTYIGKLLPVSNQRKDAVEQRVEGQVYKQNSFFPKQIVSLTQSYKIDETYGNTINIYPFQYNPITGILRTYNSVNITIYSDDNLHFPNAISPYLKKTDYINSASTSLLKSGTMYRQVQSGLLIISHPDFLNVIEDFKNWKIEKGIETEIISSALFQDSNALKAYIRSRYKNDNRRYVLLVGDAEHIPPVSSVYGDSDIAYGYLEGDDFYPELVVGRFSGTNITEIKTQVDKSIFYEKMSVADAQLYDKYILVASDEGATDNDVFEYDYEHLRLIQQKLFDATYSGGAELYDGSQGGNDALGNPLATDLLQELNNGAGYLVYTGHGDVKSLTTTGFTNDNVLSLTNKTLPFSIFAGCKIGNFSNDTCLAETFLRARNDSLNGLVVAIASSIDQWWNPPKYAQKVFTDGLIQLSDSQAEISLGALYYNSLLQMNNAYSAFGFETTDTWILFGDPTLQPVTSQLSLMNVSVPDSVTLGDTVLKINCDTENTQFCISQNNKILATTLLSVGENIVHCKPVSYRDSVILTFTAFNKEYVQKKVFVSEGDKAFVAIDSVSVQNRLHTTPLLFTDTLLVNVCLRNPTEFNSGMCSLTIDGDNALNFISSSKIFTIDAFQSNCINAAFEMLTNVVESTTLHFSLTLECNNESYTYNYTVFVVVPEVKVKTVFFTPTLYSNTNAFAEPGEIVEASFVLENVSDVNAVLDGFSVQNVDYYRHLNFTNQLDIAIGDFDTVTMLLTVPQLDSISSYVIFDVQYSVSGILSDTSIVHNTLRFVEDWETATTDLFQWKIGNDTMWNISNISYSGNYALETDNINDNDTARFEITIEVIQYDTISFFSKVSTEESYDEFYFLQDNQELLIESGVIGWTKHSFPVEPGIHTYEWAYIKDYGLSEGSDKVWIDSIAFPAMKIERFYDSVFTFFKSADTLAYVDSLFYDTLFTNIENPNIQFEVLVLPDWLSSKSDGSGGLVLWGTSVNQKRDTVLVSASVGDRYCYYYYEIESIVPSISFIEKNPDIVSVNPNPTSGLLYFSLNNESVETISITVFDIHGNILLQKMETEAQFSIDFSGFNRGQYLVLIQTDNNSVVEKVIVK